MPRQFDLLLHVEVTSAVEPLEPGPEWSAPEADAAGEAALAAEAARQAAELEAERRAAEKAAGGRAGVGHGDMPETWPEGV
jgi:hypothetical protein